MNNNAISSWLLVLICLFMTSCSSPQMQSSQLDYKSMKDMVLDIMQTEEAKKSMGKILQDEKFKQSIMMDETTVRTTLIQSMTDPNSTHIKEAFRDPKFASTLAKSMQAEHKKLMKDLMKDPEYQKQLISIMKDPEFEKNLLDLMKSAAYRQQTMQIMKESLQSPLFQEDLLKLMTKVNEEMTKPKELKSKKGGGEGEGS